MTGPAGRVVGLWRYPVKSMRGERLESCALAAAGIPGDRLWALREAATGRLGSAKLWPPLMLCAAAFVSEPGEAGPAHARVTLPGGATLDTSSPAAAERLSELLGTRFGLEAAPGKHFDDRPVHLLTTASLAALRRLEPGHDFDARRFRPNLLVEPPAGSGDFPEESWVGRRLRVGSAVLRVAKPVARCVMTTHPQEELPKDPGILKAVVARAENRLGVYAEVERPGAARLGDALTLEGAA